MAKIINLENKKPIPEIFAEKRKSKTLVNLEDKILNIVYADEKPPEEEILLTLEKIFWAGYKEAMRFTWTLEDESGPYAGKIVRTGVNAFLDTDEMKTYKLKGAE